MKENEMSENKKASCLAIKATSLLRIEIIPPQISTKSMGNIVRYESPKTIIPVPKITPRKGIINRLERKNNPGN